MTRKSCGVSLFFITFEKNSHITFKNVSPFRKENICNEYLMILLGSEISKSFRYSLYCKNGTISRKLHYLKCKRFLVGIVTILYHGSENAILCIIIILE